MESVLVSSCLLGEAVRYNGGDKRCDDEILRRWIDEKRIVTVCPEVAGGLPVPRPPAEIEGGAGGAGVLEGSARVLDNEGRDVTEQFLKGAATALEIARLRNIRIAVLKEGSPSCGSAFTYDGTFSAARVALPGVAAARLKAAGIYVFSESQLAEADRLLKQLEADDPSRHHQPGD